ncbi:hypothetical protein TNCV_1784651 [Trichonephila clavipes]|nr:hypothetical protein TNCV_1784651 [Trichonephila clavipes]
MAPKELSELTVFNRRKAHLLGQITHIRNSLENVESPLNQVEKRAKLASLSEVKAKIDKLRTESYGVLSDEELMDFEASLDTMEVDADNLEVPIAELAERWTELPQVSDESRSFFRVHTGYFSNIPKCIKAEFIASWACSQSSVCIELPALE